MSQSLIYAKNGKILGDTWTVEAGTWSITGDHAVTGNLSVSGNETVGGTLGVTGASTLSGTTCSALTVTGNETVGGTLGVTGASSIHALTVTGNETVSGTLGVTGASTLGQLTVTGSQTNAGNLVVQNTGVLTVQSTASNALNCLGACNITGILTATANATMQNKLSVGSSASDAITCTGGAVFQSTSPFSVTLFGGMTAGGGITSSASVAGTTFNMSGALSVLNTTVACTGPWVLANSHTVSYYKLNHTVIFSIIPSTSGEQNVTATTNTLVLTAVFGGLHVPASNRVFRCWMTVNGVATPGTATIIAANGNVQISTDTTTWTNGLTGSANYVIDGVYYCV